MEPLNVNVNNIRNTIQNEQSARVNNAREFSTASENRAVRTAEETPGQSGTQKAEDTAAKGVYGDLLDVSEDGDTITARPEALQALDDGLVLLKGTGQTQTANAVDPTGERLQEQSEPTESSRVIEQIKEEQAEKEEEKAEAAADAAKTVSLTGYSDDMIDTLYRQGKIDSRVYNAEMDRRERIDEMASSDDKDRVQAAQENLTETAEELGTLSAEATNDALETEAYLTAGENGRIELIKDVFANNSIN